jgi:hypothetical protein
MKTQSIVSAATTTAKKNTSNHPAFPLVKSETRSRAELDRLAKLNGFSLQSRIEAMGGPKS